MADERLLKRQIATYEGVLSGERVIHRYVNDETGELLCETALAVNDTSNFHAHEALLAGRINSCVPRYVGAVSLEEAGAELRRLNYELAALPSQRDIEHIVPDPDLL